MDQILEKGATTKNAVQDLPGKIGRTAENYDEGHETKECVKSVIL